MAMSAPSASFLYTHLGTKKWVFLLVFYSTPTCMRPDVSVRTLKKIIHNLQVEACYDYWKILDSPWHVPSRFSFGIFLKHFETIFSSVCICVCDCFLFGPISTLVGPLGSPEMRSTTSITRHWQMWIFLLKIICGGWCGLVGGRSGWPEGGFCNRNRNRPGQVAVQIIGYNSASNWAIYCFIAFTCFVCGLVAIFIYMSSSMPAELFLLLCLLCDSLFHYVASRNALVVVDNCEFNQNIKFQVEARFPLLFLKRSIHEIYIVFFRDLSSRWNCKFYCMSDSYRLYSVKFLDSGSAELASLIFFFNKITTFL